MKSIISLILVFAMIASLGGLLPERVNAAGMEKLELERPKVGNVMIDATYYTTAKLRQDGTVITVGLNKNGQCDTENWKDIVQVSTNSSHTVGLKADGTVVATGLDFNFKGVEEWSDIVQVAAGDSYTVGLKKDGTLVVTGEYRKDCPSWTDIVQIAAGYSVVGLKKDGTVVADGVNRYGECDVDGWTEIIQIATQGYITAGLKKDGTVVATGLSKDGQCDVSYWKDIVQIDVGSYIAGVKEDGTIIGTDPNWKSIASNWDKTTGGGWSEMPNWTNIVQVAAGDGYLIGLMDNGTVVASGNGEYGNCSVGDWSNITQIHSYKGWEPIIVAGLKEDGTVVAFGGNKHGECDVEDFYDIAQISVGYGRTVGLKKDGTVVAVGLNRNDSCEVGDWTGIVQVASSEFAVIGLKSDGTCVKKGSIATNKPLTDVVQLFNDYVIKKDGTVVDNYLHWMKSGWTDAIFIDPPVALKKDGTVVDTYGSIACEGWTDIIRIAHPIAVKRDGTVVDWHGKRVEGMTDIVQASYDNAIIIGLKKDGTVVSNIHDVYGWENNVKEWRDIVQVLAGPCWVLGVKSDGTIVSEGIKISPGLNSDIEYNMPDFSVKGFTDEIAVDGEIVVSVLPKKGLMFTEPPVVESKEKNVEVTYFEEDGIDKYRLKGAKIGKDTISVTATTIPNESNPSKNTISTFAKANSSTKANTASVNLPMIVKDGITIKGVIKYATGKEIKPLKNTRISIYESGQSKPNYYWTNDKGSFTINVVPKNFIKNKWTLTLQIDAAMIAKEGVLSVKTKSKQNNKIDVHSFKQQIEIRPEDLTLNNGKYCYDYKDYVIHITQAAPFFILDTVRKGRDAWPGDLKKLRVYYNTGGKFENDIQLDFADRSGAWFQESSNGIGIIHYPSNCAWSEAAILHEVGHSIMNSENGIKAGGEHRIFRHYKNSLAYNEGWANFYAHMVLNEDDLDFVNYAIRISDRNTILKSNDSGRSHTAESLYPRYLDSNGIEDPGTQIKGINYNEVNIAAILWDIYKYYGKDKEAMMRLISNRSPVDISREPTIFDLFNNVAKDTEKKYDIWKKFKNNGFPFVDLQQPTNVIIDKAKEKYKYTVTANDNIGIGRVDFFAEIKTGWLSSKTIYLGSVSNTNVKTKSFTFEIPSSITSDKDYQGKKFKLIARVFDIPAAEYTIATSSGDGWQYNDVKWQYAYKYTNIDLKRDKNPYTEVSIEDKIDNTNKKAVFSMQAFTRALSSQSDELEIEHVLVDSAEDIPEDLNSKLIRDNAIVLTGDLSDATIQQKEEIVKYVDDGGTLIITSEGSKFATEYYPELFNIKDTLKFEGIQFEQEDLSEYIGESLNEVDSLQEVIALKDNIYLTPLISQNGNIISAFADKGYGRIYWIPECVNEAVNNKLIEYTLLTACCKDTRVRTRSELSYSDNIIDKEYYYLLAPDEEQVLSINKEQEQILIGLNDMDGDIEITLSSPDGEVSFDDEDIVSDYIRKIKGEVGKVDITIKNNCDEYRCVSVFTTAPKKEVVFSGEGIKTYTNKSKVRLQGLANGYTDIKFILEEMEEGGEEKVYNVTINDGKFDEEIELTKHFNYLRVEAKDPKGNGYYTCYPIYYYAELPLIDISSDIIERVNSNEPFDTESLFISGTMDRRCDVFINGKQMAAGCDSLGGWYFGAEILLNAGENEFTIEAVDLAGNRTSQKINIKRTKEVREFNDPVIKGLSIKECTTIKENCKVKVYIKEESEYTINAWIGNKVLDVKGNVIDLDLEGLPNGQNLLNIKVTDKWDNSSDLMIALNIDKLSESEEPIEVKPGDVNGDGKVNSTDCTLLKRYILLIIEDFPTANGHIAADVNGDGKINSTDYTMLKRYILRIITSL
ncbi:dockerin type I domain-containing protein [Acetivibrio mesophilus]|uniref:Dockerin domain-containing protein n=1 Tax=Acetivibrio mesophilus TaxID=2487273 RepID=A0A4Q0I1C7_9FIRM|nr:dockerin type I domain-containing protein [Acetivibrio mesophilus]RXE57891.1 hypothetical protein EFD62_15330 [Acetivibrio mesophilus]